MWIHYYRKKYLTGIGFTSKYFHVCFNILVIIILKYLFEINK
jgi:hypothetical protein